MAQRASLTRPHARSSRSSKTSPVTEVAGEWTRATVADDAPEGAVSAYVYVVYAGVAAGEKHLVDALQIGYSELGAVHAWETGSQGVHPGGRWALIHAS